MEKTKIIPYTGLFTTMCASLKISFSQVDLNKKEFQLLDRIVSELEIVWCLNEEQIFNYIEKFLNRDDIMKYYQTVNAMAQLSEPINKNNKNKNKNGYRR